MPKSDHQSSKFCRHIPWWVSLFWLFWFSLATLPTAAQTAPAASDPADPIIKAILKDEIKLARFNLNYRLQAAQQGRWKGLRYFTLQEANAALTEAGVITSVQQHLSRLSGNSFRHLNIKALKAANVAGGVGQVMAAGSSGLEFVINTYHSRKAARNGFSPATAVFYTRQITTRIDQHLEQLNSLAESEEPHLAQVHLKEAKVLADIRDLLLSEFSDFHARARRILWGQQSFYILDIAKNVTGSLAHLYAYKTLQDRSPVYNRPAGVLTMISGALILSNPITSRLLGRAAATFDKHQLLACGLSSGKTSHKHLENDLRELKMCLKDTPESELLLYRPALYEAHQRRLLRQLEINSREIQAGNRIAIQNILSGMFVGGTKLAFGIMFTDAGFNNHRNGKVSNALLGSGSLTYLPGASWAMLDNARIQLVSEVERHRMRKTHTLPSQLIAEQLDNLDRLEKSLE